MMEPTHFLWSGRLRERGPQERLCRRLRPLAETFSARFGDQPSIRFHEETLKGRIVISPALFAPSPSGIGLIEIPPGKDPAAEGQARFIQADEISAYGMDFHCFTGEFRNSRDDDRASFVFIRSRRHPELEGAMARIDDRSSIHIAQAPLVQEADYYISPPRMRVPFLFGFWFRDLLLWTYQFFAPGMEMWENDKLVQKKYFSDTSPGREADESAVLERVANMYDSAAKLSVMCEAKRKTREK